MNEGPVDFGRLAVLAKNAAANTANMSTVMDQINEAQHRRANPVIDVCAALKAYVEEFEGSLDAEHEVAVRLVSFGREFVFHAQEIGYTMPNVITFIGVTEDGEKVQLIQHVTQLSFLLKAATKIGSAAHRVTFH
jgi:hypothetical protein